MKKIMVMIALAALVGCEAGSRVSYEVADKQKQRCDAIHGETVFVKYMNGTVGSVDCVVDGSVYRMGAY